jgi:hypothetical protein
MVCHANVIAIIAFVLGLLGCWHKISTNVLKYGIVTVMLLDIVGMLIMFLGFNQFCTRFFEIRQ